MKYKTDRPQQQSISFIFHEFFIFILKAQNILYCLSIRLTQLH
jgi:hypothetical protein